MEIKPYNNQSFNGVVVMKNIQKKLPKLIDNHIKTIEKEILAYQKGEGDRLKYDIVELKTDQRLINPYKIFGEMVENQKQNKLSDIIIGYFKFSKFGKPIPGIKVITPASTYVKKLDFDALDVRFQAPVTESAEKTAIIRSEFFDTLAQAEQITNFAGRIYGKVAHGQLKFVDSVYKDLKEILLSSEALKTLREKHNISIETSSAIDKYSKIKRYNEFVYVNIDSPQTEAFYFIRGVGKSKNEAQKDLIKKINSTNIDDIADSMMLTHQFDINNPTFVPTQVRNKSH